LTLPAASLVFRIGDAVCRDRAGVDEFHRPSLPGSLFHCQAEQIQRAFNIDPVCCLRIVFGLGGENGSQVVDGSDFKFHNQAAEDHRIQDVTQNKPLTVLHERFIQRADV